MRAGGVEPPFRKDGNYFLDNSTGPPQVGRDTPSVHQHLHLLGGERMTRRGKRRSHRTYSYDKRKKAADVST